MVNESTSIRGLVVDDDPEVVAYLTTVLRRRGIDAESADDGSEAARLLQGNEYDVAFIDLLLPRLSGEGLLRQIERGTLKRPVSLALISAANNLADVSHGSWARNVTLLSKPFASVDVATFIDRAFLAPERETAQRPIVLAGAGLWCEAAALVAHRRGARCVMATSPQHIREVCEADFPLAIVLGPPVDRADLAQIATDVKAGRGGSDIAVFVALPDEDAEHTAELLTLGVDRVVSIANGVVGLSEELLRVANLKRRVHRRVPLATRVIVHEDRTVHTGDTFDVGEGGIGMVMETRPDSRSVIAEFMLPGDKAPISAHSEIAWVDERDPARGRFGLRFTKVSGADRLRSFVAES